MSYDKGPKYPKTCTSMDPVLGIAIVDWGVNFIEESVERGHIS